MTTRAGTAVAVPAWWCPAPAMLAGQRRGREPSRCLPAQQPSYRGPWRRAPHRVGLGEGLVLSGHRCLAGLCRSSPAGARWTAGSRTGRRDRSACCPTPATTHTAGSWNSQPCWPGRRYRSSPTAAPAETTTPGCRSMPTGCPTMPTGCPTMPTWLPEVCITGWDCCGVLLTGACCTGTAAAPAWQLQHLASEDAVRVRADHLLVPGVERLPGDPEPGRDAGQSVAGLHGVGPYLMCLGMPGHGVGG